MRRALLVFAFLLPVVARADDAPSYARQIRPILAKHCFECHNAKSQKGGLDLETYKALREGGDNGPVVVPGKAVESKLVVLMEGKEKPIMPPAKIAVRPTNVEIALLRDWVNAGAKDDGAVKVSIPDVKPKKALLPPVTAVVALTAADKFLAARGRELFGAESTKYPRMAETISAIKPLGQDFLVVASGSPGSKSRVLVVDGAGGVHGPWIEHDDAVLDLATSQSRFVASAGYDTRIRLLQFFLRRDKKPNFDDVAKPIVLKDHSDAVHGLAFHPDGMRLASCSADRTVKIWEVPSGKLVQTLSDATDWLYAIAWSPDGKLIAAGGVDKSIRIYEWNGQEARLVRSNFGHEGPVLKLAFAANGRSLYSLGQDRIVKSWDPATLAERQVFPRLPEDGVTLAAAADKDSRLLAVGRYDGEVQVLTADEVPEPKTADPFPEVKETGVNDSPTRGQKVSLPARIVGQLDRPGDVDYFQFDVKQGDRLGVELILPKETKLASQLQLVDLRGRVLAESDRGFLGHVFSDGGTFALGVRDRELRGGKEYGYVLRLGDVPVVTSFAPLGGARGTTVPVLVKGVFLDEAMLSVPIPKDAALGSKIAVPVTSKRGVPRGAPNLVVGEFPETAANVIAVPGTGNGVVEPGKTDRWSFEAKKGQRLLVDVNARRLGSQLDSIVEIHDATGKLVERAVLRCLAKTNVTFREHDSATSGIRLEAWNELAINDLTYVDGELLKIRGLPVSPDADCVFFNVRGRRFAYLDTTPIHHTNTAVYKVSVHPPGTTFPPNGFPVFTIPYRNDDGGPGYERDSRIFFDPPVDGTYYAVIRDVRNLGGPEYGYRLTVRPPRPSFAVSFTPTQPTVARGAGASLNLAVERFDGYDGPIDLHFENLPPGFHVPTTRIDPDIWNIAVPIYAAADATIDDKSPPLTLVGSAKIDGKTFTSKSVGGLPKLQDDPGDLIVTADEKGVFLKPGSTATLKVRIERRNGAKGRVPVDVRGLPHGVTLLDVGLNGILVNEDETERTIVFAAEPWMEAGVRPVAIVARSESKNTEHGAKAVLITIGK